VVSVAHDFLLESFLTGNDALRVQEGPSWTINQAAAAGGQYVLLVAGEGFEPSTFGL
jgi:hypothetical protein